MVSKDCIDFFVFLMLYVSPPRVCLFKGWVSVLFDSHVTNPIRRAFLLDKIIAPDPFFEVTLREDGCKHFLCYYGALGERPWMVVCSFNSTDGEKLFSVRPSSVIMEGNQFS